MIRIMDKRIGYRTENLLLKQKFSNFSSIIREGTNSLNKTP